MSAFDDFRVKARQSGSVATAGIMTALVAGFLTNWFLHGSAAQLMAFTPGSLTSAPWTLVTYPFVQFEFIGVFFSCLWLWGVGGAVERDLGSGRYLVLWLALSALGALSVSLITPLMGHAVPFALIGTLIPLGAVTVIWGTRNPSAMMTLMFVLPITGKWMAWLSAGVVLFGMGMGNPMLGALAVVPLVVGWAFADNRIPGLPYGKSEPKRAAWKPSERDDKYFDEVRKREKDREEREKLRRLFEGSIKDNPEDDRGSSSGR